MVLPQGKRGGTRVEPMIAVIEPESRATFPELLENAFRLRARALAGRPGRDANIRADMEIDGIDARGPAYLVGLDEDGCVVSTLRAARREDPARMRGASALSLTRLRVDTARLAKRGPAAPARAAVATLVALLEMADHAFATWPARWQRWFLATWTRRRPIRRSTT
jgi:N-acyl-L-homoserine lactone synthetase